MNKRVVVMLEEIIDTNDLDDDVVDEIRQVIEVLIKEEEVEATEHTNLEEEEDAEGEGEETPPAA